MCIFYNFPWFFTRSDVSFVFCNNYAAAAVIIYRSKNRGVSDQGQRFGQEAMGFYFLVAQPISSQILESPIQPKNILAFLEINILLN